MPLYKRVYLPSYKSQLPAVREKATEIANDLVLKGALVGIVIPTGIKNAREFFAQGRSEGEKKRKG